MLPYPLRYLATDGGNDLTLFVENQSKQPLVDNNWFILCVTPQQMTDILSVVNIGAPIVFPDTYNVMFQLFAQLNEYPNEIPEESCMDLCTLILNCINTNTDIQNAIALYGRTAGLEGTTPSNPTIEGTNILRDNPDCNPDNLFGAITGMVDFINSTAEDIIEIWSNQVSQGGRIGDLIESIPIIGEAPLDDIFQLMEGFVEDLFQNYLASYTVALRDEYRCDLFCLMKDNCQFDMLALFDYFNDRLTVSLSLTNVNDFIQLMLSQQNTGTALVDAFHAFAIGTMLFGGDIIGIDLDKFVTIVSSMFNDADSDWNILCTDCGWTSQLDFTTSDYGFVISTWDGGTAGGSWVSGTGFVSSAVQISGVNNNLVYISLSTDSFTLTDFQTTGTLNECTTSHVQSLSAVQTYLQNLGANIAPSVTTIPFSSFTSGVLTNTSTSRTGLSATADKIWIRYRACQNGSGGQTIIQSATISGTGTKPTQLP